MSKRHPQLGQQLDWTFSQIFTGCELVLLAETDAHDGILRFIENSGSSEDVYSCCLLKRPQFQTEEILLKPECSTGSAMIFWRLFHHWFLHFPDCLYLVFLIVLDVFKTKRWTVISTSTKNMSKDNKCSCLVAWPIPFWRGNTQPLQFIHFHFSKVVPHTRQFQLH